MLLACSWLCCASEVVASLKTLLDVAVGASFTSGCAGVSAAGGFASGVLPTQLHDQ